jgi:hypothetical protein
MDKSTEWMKKDYIKKLFNWIPTGRRKRGRPKTTWKEGILRAVEECGLQDGNWVDRLCRRLVVERHCHTS